MNKAVGIIGYGNMGSCIGGRLNSAGFDTIVFDKDTSKTQSFAQSQITATALDLIDRVEAVILAVKPQDFGNILEEIKNHVGEKLIISIAAGITTGYIEKYLGNVRVIRTMPNIAARIGRGITCLCKGKFVNEMDLSFARKLFDTLGKTLILDEEDMIDAATAISGSGPGFCFYLIENNKLDINHQDDIDKFTKDLEKSAESLGFSEHDAIILAEATTSGSIQLLKETGTSPSELREQITSKGGTTEAGLKILQQGGTLEEVAKAAQERAKELSRR